MNSVDRLFITERNMLIVAWLVVTILAIFAGDGVHDWFRLRPYPDAMGILALVFAFITTSMAILGGVGTLASAQALTRYGSNEERALWCGAFSTMFLGYLYGAMIAPVNSLSDFYLFVTAQMPPIAFGCALGATIIIIALNSRIRLH